MPPWIVPLSLPMATSWARPSLAVHVGSSSVFGQPASPAASFPEAGGEPNQGRPTPLEDDTMIISSDDLGMAPEITIGLESEVLDLNADPNSVEQELGTDVLPPPTTVVLEADVAIEISMLLQEIPSAQPWGSATPERSVSPEVWNTLMEQPVPTCLLDLLRPLFQVKLLTVPGWVQAAALCPAENRNAGIENTALHSFIVYHWVGDGEATDGGTVPSAVATIGHRAFQGSESSSRLGNPSGLTILGRSTS